MLGVERAAHTNATVSAITIVTGAVVEDEQGGESAARLTCHVQTQLGGDRRTDCALTSTHTHRIK